MSSPGDAPIAPDDTRRQVASALAFALVLGTVYQTMTLTDLTGDVIRKGIEADSYQMLWATVASTAAMFVGLMSGGSLAGRFGMRGVLILGLAVFALGNLLCGMAGSLAAMVVARAVEGVGKGVATMAGRRSLYQQFDRRLLIAIGFYGVVAYSTRHISPLIAAVLNDQLSWRWVYWGNVPLALLAIAAVLATFHPDAPDHPQPIRPPWVSMALLVTWVMALTITLGWYRRWQGWISNSFVLTATISVLAPTLLMARLLAGPHPDGHLRRFLSSRVMILSMMARVLMLVYLSSVPAIMASYMTEARGYTRPQAGLILAASTLPMALATVLTTAFQRRGLRHVWLVVGVVGSSACLWGIAGVDNYTAKGVVAARLAAWAFFLGLFPPVFLTDEVEGSNPKDAAFAIGVELALLFLSLAFVPSLTKIAIQGWTARAQDTMRLNIGRDRPAVIDAAARIGAYYLHNGLTPGDAESATSHLLGEYVQRESVVVGLRWGLQFLSLVMLGLGLLISIAPGIAARGLKAPPDSGYT